MVFLPHWPKFVGARPIDLQLHRVYHALELLGNPHLRLPPVIHIAGTNGKGSSSAYLRAMLEAAGHAVHVYTSPHLLHFNERIVLGGRRIDDGELYSLMEYCRLRLDEEDITYFEACTVAAFHAFAEHPADFLVLETGMGGRLDATNVIERPAACLVTSISMDHMEYLGETLPLIAAEKAGIIKRDVPCVTTCRNDEALTVLRAKADETHAPFLAYEYDWGIEPGDAVHTFVAEGVRVPFPDPALPGKHQILNAGGAAAVCALALRPQGFRIPDDAIAQGARAATWPGRLQYMREGRALNMLPEGWSLLLDGAHNPGGAEVLAEYLREKHAGETIYLAVGQTRGRDTFTFLEHFTGIARHIYATAVFTEPSAYRGERIAEAALKMGFPATAHEGYDDIAAFIRANPPPEGPGLLVCCGSLYLLSDVLRLNKNEPL